MTLRFVAILVFKASESWGLKLAKGLRQRQAVNSNFKVMIT